MRSITQVRGRGKVLPVTTAAQALGPLEARETRAVLIQTLIPIGLEAAAELLEADVTALAGPKYARGQRAGYYRWSHEVRPIYLADQKVHVRVPRVRDLARNAEVPLPSYQTLRSPRRAHELAFRRVLHGLSCRDYAGCVGPAVEALGLSPSSVSRQFQARSAAQLQALQERDLSAYDLVGLLLDGKSFGTDQIVIALGVTLGGKKVVLGFVQTATENQRTCSEFLRSLLDRGLRYEQGLLVVLDGARGLRKAVQTVFGECAVVQRCQWHKRENVVSYVPKSQQSAVRRKLQQAYEQPSYAEARAALQALAAELERTNASAAASLREGLEETLTVHRLGLGQALRWTFKTTNMIENVNFLVAWRTDKVDYWKNARQKHRWLAAALLDIEPRLHRVKGYRALPRLRQALQADLGQATSARSPKHKPVEPLALFNGERH